MTDVLIVIFTGVVALSTLFYAGLTCWLVIETRRMRQVQTEPKVSVFVELNEYTRTGMDLVIRNVGQGPAYNIRFDFEGDPTILRDDPPLNELPIIRDGLGFLAPNSSFRFLLGFFTPNRYHQVIQNSWSFKVSYDNQGGQPHLETFNVDFSLFSEHYLAGRSPLPRIEEHLRNLQKDINNLLTGSNKIRVITQTHEEERRGMEEFLRDRMNDSVPEGGEQGV
jgi:hypothetical protein